MPSHIARAYADRLKSGLLTADPAQQSAIAALTRLEKDLGKRGVFGGLPEVRGLYLWGPPGRGKSILMDLFFASAPEPRKTRAHFHAFMARVHDLIRQWRTGDQKARRAVFGTHRGDDPIDPVAALIASEARLLCFDELQVTDIADAMILGRLFDALFERKVVVCITSNRAPDQLYKDGINRPLFVPFIERIRGRCQVVALSGARDWRLDRIKASRVWYDPGRQQGGEAGARREGFEQLWTDLKGDMPECPAHLAVLGRDVVIQRTAGGLARAQIDQPHAQLLGRRDGRRSAVVFHDQGLGIQVGKIELEFVGAVGRVERRRGHAARGAEKTGRHLGAVGQHDGDTLVALDAQAVQRGQRALHELAQAAVAQRRPAGRGDGHRVIGGRGQHAKQ